MSDSLNRVVPALLMLGAAAVYLQLWGHGFVDFDDFAYVVDNPRIREPLGWAAIQRAFSEPYAAYWLPLTWLSLHLDFELWGLEAGAYLLTNAALHGIAGALIYLAFARMTRAPWAAAFVAAVHVLHPLHVESVAWVTERKDCLSGVFLGLTLLLYARYVDTPERRLRLLAVLAAFTAGLLSKSTLVTLPCALLLLDYWPLKRLSWGAALEKLPLLVVALAASYVTSLTQREGGGMEIAPLVSLESRVLHAVESYGWYIFKTLWPTDLAAIYPHPLAAPPLGRALAVLGVLVAISVWVLRGARQKPWRAVGWLWFLGTLVPMIGIVAAGIQLRADRFMYVPMHGLALLVAFELRDRFAGSTRGRRGLAWAAGAACLAMGIVSSLQAGHWRSSETLFRRAIAVDPDNWYAHNRLAEHFRREEQYDLAEPHWIRAAQERPHLTMPLTQLAALYELRGEMGAGAELRRVAGTLRLGDPEAAAKVGVGFLNIERHEAALPLLEDAVTREPGSARLLAELAICLDRLDRRTEAAERNREALAADPDWYFAASNLAWILATSDDPELRDPAEARRLARRAMDAMPRPEPAGYDILAAAQAADGDFETAAATAEEAASMAEARGNAGFAATLRDRAQGYRLGIPLRP